MGKLNTSNAILICMLAIAQAMPAFCNTTAQINKGNLSQLDLSKFASPDAFYWPGYIWFWNDRLSEEVLSSQLQDMSSHGARSVWPLPTPKEFRPNNMVTTLEPDYLSPEYLRLYRYMVQEARRLRMKVWLYDDGGWPSGGACGRVLKEKPDLAAQYIERVEIKPRDGETVGIPNDCIAAFLYEGPSTIRLKPGEERQIAGDGSSLVVFRTSRSGRPDFLTPRAAREFIRMSHESYRKAVGRYFGGTIPLVFSDEPTHGVSSRFYPWTDGLATDFRIKHDYDIRDYLPALFDPNNPEHSRVRIDFYDCWTELFAESFFGTIQKWAHRNNFLSAGHLGGDSTIYDSASSGHLLRYLRNYDIPGCDAIWRQIFPGADSLISPKFASTVAHQEGRPWAITESFCVYGSGLTPEQMKWILDYQYVRGDNIAAFGSYSLSTRENYMAQDQRPNFGPTNPLWKYMDSLHTYIARMSYLLSLGTPAIETAVYYPARDIWAADSNMKEVATSTERLARLLFENQCDFDFIDDDVLERKSTKIENGNLKAGPMSYRTIIVCRTKWMSNRSKKRLAEFSRAGGEILWVDSAQDSTTDGGLSIGFDELTKHIKPLVRVKPESSTIRVCKRRISSGNLYFITNESLGAASCTVEFDERLPIVQLDPESGKCLKPSSAAFDGEKWSVPLDLSFAGSCVLFFTDKRPALAAPPEKSVETLLSFQDGWSCRKLRAYRIGNQNFEIDDLPNEQPVPIELGDWRNKLGEDFSGDAEYGLTFKCSEDVANKAKFINLGEVRYACKVVLNDKELGNSAWQPYELPICGALRAGVNELRITVTNTLANQYITTKAFDKYAPPLIGPYHGKALEFERDSLPSGLYGPVTIKM